MPSGSVRGHAPSRPPSCPAASSSVTRTPRSASTSAADTPAMPPPTTTAEVSRWTRIGRSARGVTTARGRIPSSPRTARSDTGGPYRALAPGSRPARGVTYGPGMTLALTEEQELLRSTAADFVDSEVVPNRARWDRDELVDREIVGRLGELGFLGLTLPEELGGTPVDSRSYCLLMEELGRGDSAIRGIVSVSLGLVGKSIAGYGTEDQKQAVAAGHRLRGDAGLLRADRARHRLGRRQPHRPGDPGRLRPGADWLLTGEKVFITNGTWAQVALVFARTGGPGPRGVTAFLVPTGAAGFEAREIKGKLGLRGQATASLHLDEVRVPDANRLGDEGKGFRVAMSALDKGRMSIAAGCVGIARGCLEAATAVRDRAGAVRQADRRRTSWCRSCSPTPRSTWTPPGCSPGWPPTCSTAASR